jgi:hypothetical protein
MTENETSRHECLMCEDTGIEPGTDEYCTFCKRGFDVAIRRGAHLAAPPESDEP